MNSSSKEGIVHMASFPIEQHGSSSKGRNRVRRTTARDAARPLRIGVLGLSRETETTLIEPLSRAALPVCPIQIRLGTAEQSARDVAFLRGAPGSFTRAILDEPLDGLILAGTPEGELDLEKLANWRELDEILEYARGFIPSTLGLGTGGLALARAVGLDVVPLDRALSGLVPQRSLGNEHALLHGSEVFFSAESRHFRLTDASIDRAVEERRVRPLAYSRDAGVSIFESVDRRFVAHLGRPERNPPRPEPGTHFSAFFDSARESARAHAASFFAGWVRRVYELGRGNREASFSALAR
jgi:homoserine O-succinyltransferase